MRGTLTWLQTNFQREPHRGEQDVVHVGLERSFPADERWNEISMSHEVKREEIGSELVSTILLRFVNMTREAVEIQNPARALAFRGRIDIVIQDHPSFVPVIVTLRYRLPWSGMEALMRDIELDAEAIRTWLKSKPVPKPKKVEIPA